MFKVSMGAVCVVLALILGNALIVSGESSDDTMCIPMGTITLEPPEGAEAKRPPVNFPHPVHFSFNCQQCHHTWEMDAPIESCTTSGCHDGVVAPTKAQKGAPSEDPKELAVSYYKTAYHRLCISCHKEMKLQNIKLETSGKVIKEKLPNTGPTSCRSCHVKEE